MKLNHPLLYKKKTLNKAPFSILKTSKKESINWSLELIAHGL